MAIERPLSRGIGIWLYDTATYQEVALLIGQSGRVRCVAFSLDGRTLATAGWYRTVRLWNTATGEHLRTCAGHAEAMAS